MLIGRFTSNEGHHEDDALLQGTSAGQADYIGAALNSHLTSVDQGVNLQKINSDLVLHPFANRSETAFTFDNQKEPWSGIRVRRALSPMNRSDIFAYLRVDKE